MDKFIKEQPQGSQSSAEASFKPRKTIIIVPVLAASMHWQVILPMQQSAKSHDALYKELTGALKEISIFDSELAHGFGTTVVADGVEDVETYNCLCEMGCDKIQGYYISRPLSVEKFADWYSASE